MPRRISRELKTLSVWALTSVISGCIGTGGIAPQGQAINANTLAIARYLQKHPKVAWVNYPGLEDHPEHALAQKYLRGGGASGLFTFGLPGGREAGARFLDALQLFLRLVNIGDTRSLATHPASTTHRQLSPQELEQAGVSEDTVRLCVGIEHVDDLLADLEQALAAA